MPIDDAVVPGADLTRGRHDVEVDPVQLQALMDRMRTEQSLPRGLLAGMLAGIGAALLWGFLAKVTGYEIGWIAIGVGFVVGIAVRKFGRGIDARFSVMGAGLALLAVMLGKVLAICMFVATERGLNCLEVFNALPFRVMAGLLRDSFGGVDLLFYCLATWAGWQYATRQMTQQELADILRPTRPQTAPPPTLPRL